MMPPPDPSLLVALREAVPWPDWRRDRALDGAAGLAARVADTEAGWTPAQRSEAAYLLARATPDAIAAMEALCDLAAEDAPRRGWALGEMQRLGLEWPALRGAWPKECLPGLADRLDIAFARLAAALPADAIARLAHAAVIQEFRDAGAALDRLEQGLAAGAPIGAAYLARLALLLASQPSAATIARSLAVPEALRTGAGWPVFRLHRTVAFATAWAQQGVLQRDGRIDGEAVQALLALPPAELHILGRVADALAPLAGMSAGDAAAHLRALADNVLFRLSPVPGAEVARCAVLDAMLEIVQRPTLPAAERRALLAKLIDFAPATLRFWSEPAFRHRVCDLVLAQADAVPDAMASYLRGVFAFAREDPEAAALAFAANAADWPDAAGPGTYLSPAATARLLAEDNGRPSPDEALADESLAFETLASAPHSADLPCVVITGNDRYVALFGPGYAAALARVAPVGRLHLHLVGDPATIRPSVAAMLAALPGYGVTLSAEPVTVDAPYYFATARFLRLPFLLARLGGPLVLTDIDAPWTEKPAALLERRAAGSDVGLRLNARPECGRWPGIACYLHLMPQRLPWHVVNASLMTFAPTAGAVRFAALLARLATAALRRAAGLSRNGAWGIDQNVLLAAHGHARRHDPAIRFADLGPPGALPPDRVPAFMRAPEGRHWLFPDPAGAESRRSPLE